MYLLLSRVVRGIWIIGNYDEAYKKIPKNFWKLMKEKNVCGTFRIRKSTLFLREFHKSLEKFSNFLKFVKCFWSVLNYLKCYNSKLSSALKLSPGAGYVLWGVVLSGTHSNLNNAK